MREAADLVVEAVSSSRQNTEGWWRVTCPFCSPFKPDPKRSLAVGSRTGYYICNRCGEHGFASELSSGLLPEAFERVHAPPKEIPAPEGFFEIGKGPGLSALCMETARRYAASRGLSQALAEELGAGAAVGSRYAGRLIVPIRDAVGRWLGWVGRDFTGTAKQPYLYPPGMSRGEVFFNEAALGLCTDAPVAVVEGVFDAVHLWPDAVAVLGKPSGSQVQKLVNAPRPIAVVLDGDAWIEGEALAWQLRLQEQRAGSVRLPAKIDPDEIMPAVLRTAMVKCIGAAGSVDL